VEYGSALSDFHLVSRAAGPKSQFRECNRLLRRCTITKTGGVRLAQQHQSLTAVSNPTTRRKDAEVRFRETEEIFRLLVEGVQDYAIFLLDSEGTVRTWNIGAERLKGYKAEEIIGQHFSCFYPGEARESHWPERELEIAAKEGRFSDEGWRIKKDGSTFWASVVITALHSADGELRGFSKVTRDLTERRNLEERTQQLNKELRGRLGQVIESRRQIELRTLELQRLSGRLLQIQDDERRRIARELHDELGQLLVAIKLALQAHGHGSTEEQKVEATQLTDEALSKVRNLSHLLHPPLLDESGLLPALHWYIDGLQKRSKLRITFDCRPIAFPRLNGEIETAIFRIIQESLTNIYRHSGSADARVELHLQADRVLIRVRDYGKGAAFEGGLVGALAPVGLGISGMRERIKQLDGEFRVSRAEPGTLVEASIPLFPSAHEQIL
jgi:PAS domain S-box-containing protein